MELAHVREELEARIRETAPKHPACEGATVEVHDRGFQAEGYVTDDGIEIVPVRSFVRKLCAGDLV
jgi:hypothetical protein